MRRALAFAVLLGCAHAQPPPEAETEAAPVEGKGNLQLADDVTPPVRKSCRSKGPRLAARDRPSGSMIVDYLVTAEGKVSDVAVEGNASESAVRAVRRYLESCRYAPATRAGKPIAVKWKGELTFPETR
jgi:outer membrane biosynthesis protein TonB